MVLDPEKIKTEGIKILEEFSEKLKDIPETKETHYVVDIRNVTRGDGEPRQCNGFRDKFSKLVPQWEENYVVTEKGV